MFTREFYDLFQKRKAEVGWGQSEFLLLFFYKNLQLIILKMPRCHVLG